MADVKPEDINLDDPPFPLTAIDRQVLATPDEEYHRITWEDLKHIIGTSPPFPHRLKYTQERIISNDQNQPPTRSSS